MYTYWYWCNFFTFILLLSFCYGYFFLVQAAIIQFSVIMKSACSASGETMVTQTSDRGQRVIRQWSGNYQAVVRQSIRKPVHNC